MQPTKLLSLAAAVSIVFLSCQREIDFDTLPPTPPPPPPVLNMPVIISFAPDSVRVNEEVIIKGKFFWGRGYGAFSVSHSDVERVARYIANQEEHHRKRTFREEYIKMLNDTDVDNDDRYIFKSLSWIENRD